MAKNLQNFFWFWKKLSHSKLNMFTKTQWKGNKRSKQNTTKVVSVLRRVLF